MSQIRMHVALDIFDYAGNKICSLYDSSIDAPGQAYHIVYTMELSGWQSLSFVMPRVVDDVQNFRWDFIKPEYKVRLTVGNRKEWFYINQPKRVRNASSVTNTVDCDHICRNLKTKSVYLTFNDTNGIGHIDELAERILKGTGWSLGLCDTLYEDDGTTEKTRSLKSENKKGAYQLIADLCSLFSARPVFHGDTHKVDFFAIEDRSDLREMQIGKDLISLTSTYKSDDIVTRLYVEGEYATDGYVGIDSVNPTGLNYIFNFDYYKEIGLFTAEHETIYQDYITNITQMKRDIADHMETMTENQNSLNTLWGQFDYVLFFIASGHVVNYVFGGDADADDAVLNEGDKLIVCDGDTAYREVTAGSGGSISYTQQDRYSLKYVTKSAGAVGALEVSIEAKQKAWDQAKEKYDEATDESTKKIYHDQMESLEDEIESMEPKLHEKMNQAMVLRKTLELEQSDLNTLLYDQDVIEENFVVAMGDLLRDGYWSNKNYVLGQEEFLYHDAMKVLKDLSKPTVKYTVTRASMTNQLGYGIDDYPVNTQVRIYDPLIGVNDLVYIKKIQLHLDEPDKDTVELDNASIVVGGKSLDSVLQRVTELATALDQKQSLYDRAKAVNHDGNIYVERLEGTIDLMRTKLMSAVSSWYTDDQGNIMFEAADGQSAMKLCGDGFMIADGKTADEEWNWRTKMCHWFGSQ